MNNETLQSSLHSYIEDAIEEEKMEIANNMLNESLPIKQIARITQLVLSDSLQKIRFIPE